MVRASTCEFEVDTIQSIATLLDLDPNFLIMHYSHFSLVGSRTPWPLFGSRNLVTLPCLGPLLWNSPPGPRSHRPSPSLIWFSTDTVSSACLVDSHTILFRLGFFIELISIWNELVCTLAYWFVVYFSQACKFHRSNHSSASPQCLAHSNHSMNIYRVS